MNNETEFVDEEGTENEEDLGKQDPSVYSKAVMWGTDWTAETIVSQLRRKNIDLNPDFQRRDAWDINKKSKFIESLIIGLPVPPIILAEKKDKKNSYLVIDGKQRLLSIMQFCSDDTDNLFDQLILKDLEILSDINGYNYSALEKISSNKDYITQFDNQTIRTVVIRNWPNEKFLYTVFLRLNTGSLKLSPQELRQALHPGDFLTFVNDYSKDDNIIRNVLKLKKADARMRDIELIVRYFAFKNFLPLYKDSLKEFLDIACKDLNSEWILNSSKYNEQMKELEEAIKFTTSIFGEKNRFSKYVDGEYTNNFNRTIFDIMVYHFSDKVKRNKLIEKKERIKSAFENLMSTNIDFISSVSGSTKDLDKTSKRYLIWEKELDKLI